MKTCRTLNGLLKAIEKGERCRLTYTDCRRSGSGGYIIYQTSGTNLLVSDETFEKIKPYLEKV